MSLTVGSQIGFQYLQPPIILVIIAVQVIELKHINTE